MINRLKYCARCRDNYPFAGVKTMSNKEIAIYDCALELWGHESQIDMTIEECAELIQALMKYRRKQGDHDEALESVIEEIADVEIMLGQMKVLFDFQGNKVEYAKRRKLRRLEEMIYDAKGEG